MSRKSRLVPARDKARADEPELEGRKMIRHILAATAALAGSAAMASQPSKPLPTGESPDTPGVICKYVVGEGRARDAKPYQLCERQAYWDAKQSADDADANHVECHYQEISGSRLRVGKRCMTADMWRQERQMTADYIQQIQAATAGPH